MKIDLFALLLAFVAVASNPIMKYSFCPLLSDCEPATFASDSGLLFGNITSGTLFYRPNEALKLSVSCSFHEPIHWILTVSQNSRVISVSNSFTKNGSHRLYYYNIRFPGYLISPDGLIRCESYDNPDLAAEIYIAQNRPTPLYSNVDLALEGFLVTPPNRNSQLTVPCLLSGFDQNLDPSASQLSKIKLSDMRSTVVNPKCLTCFPRTQAGSEVNCNSSCPYDITRRAWSEAGMPLGVKITGNQWLDCISDDACAVKVIKYAPHLPKLSCNKDHSEWTCSDHYTSLSLYPNTCHIYQWKKRQNNFKKIEACIVKNYARVLDSTEANYDPRVGFRLKNERDMDAVYICNSTTQLTYLFPLDPKMRMDTRIQMSTRNMNDSFKGFICLVRTRSYELMDMELLPCSTLFDCEIQLRTQEVSTPR